MKFAKSALSLLLLSRAASAWTSAAARPRFVARNILATQFHASSSAVTDSYSTEVVGKEKTESFRLAFKEAAGATISPWHDIPLKNADGSYNMVRFFWFVAWTGLECFLFCRYCCHAQTDKQLHDSRLPAVLTQLTYYWNLTHLQYSLSFRLKFDTRHPTIHFVLSRLLKFPK